MPLPSLVYIKVNRAKGTDKQSLLLQMGKVGEEVDSALKKMRIIQVGNERKGRVLWGREGKGREGKGREGKEREIIWVASVARK